MIVALGFASLIGSWLLGAAESKASIAPDRISLFNGRRPGRNYKRSPGVLLAEIAHQKLNLSRWVRPTDQCGASQ